MTDIAVDIVGTWRLVATKAHDDAGKPLPPPYGPTPTGVVTFQADGRMLTVLCDGRATLSKRLSARLQWALCGHGLQRTLLAPPAAGANGPRGHPMRGAAR